MIQGSLVRLQRLGRIWSSMSELRVFKEEPGFIKLFQLFKEKYRSLGRIGGTIPLKGFTDVELESIAGFLGWSKEKLIKKGAIALADFEKELASTSFSDYQLVPLIEAVLGEKILSKKEEIEREQAEENTFIDSLLREIPEVDWWLDWIQRKPVDSRWIWSQYRQNRTELAEKIIVVAKAFTALPGEGKFERLPFFSQRVTGNPHFFDNQELASKLLHHFMYVDLMRRGRDINGMPRTVEELNDVLSEFGILRDDLWNFVTCQQLRAKCGEVDHPVWKAACESGTVMNVPMKELIKIDGVRPHNGDKVWIVENSSVSSTVMDAVLDAPIVCTHGQLRMASWRLLDLLVAAETTLYYSGDLDPEGIVIADRLKRRYGAKLVLWRMDVDSYRTSLSSEDVASRLNKLQAIESVEWTPVIEEMKKTGKAGYQEALATQMIEDIKRGMKG